ncbi:MAG: phosphatidylserine decarboxylase family protein [Propionibacteriales bacterium]|nr:phosphatidylserine decarboxylase family protein [Propionibacteriales bacterium]
MPTTIDREAWSAAAVGAVPAVLAGFLGRKRAATILLGLPVGIVAFFRDPDRRVDATAVDEDTVLAPADGKVMHAGPGQPGVAPPPTDQGDWQQVSIFLSVFDVHINRAPYGGRIRSVTHRPGRWLAAYKFESATENERSDIVVEREVGGRTRTIVFRQIVGAVARRVVTRVQAGDDVATGERIGLMKFGSRMDVFVPPDVELTVAKGDRTVAGETVIGRWTR